MANELLVVLNRSEHSGFGFSLLGEPGLPPIIYNILDDSPAAESGEVEVGDVILKVNETDVVRFNTKEDPKIKAIVRKHLLSTGGEIEKSSKLPAVHAANITAISSSILETAIHKAHRNRIGGYIEKDPLVHQEQQKALLAEHDRLQWQPLGANKDQTKSPPKFEAYMMTGEHILNISKMPPTTAIVPKQQKKMENLRYHNSHTHHLRHQQSISNSVPNSPNELDMGHKKSGPNSANTSPISANKRDQHQASSVDTYNYVRTSRSEDQLQGQSELYPLSVANSEADEDVSNSLNILLDTRPDNANSNSDSDRIVWTYNAPITDQHKFAHALSNGSSSSQSNVSPTLSSPLHSSESPASPTSVSSSVMSSQSGSKRIPYGLSNGPLSHQHGDYSVSEALSNISSPDYHDDDIGGLCDCVMEISDHSDSDSTLMVSEPRTRHARVHNTNSSDASGDHKIVIQVKGPDKDKNKQSNSTSTLKADSEGYQISDEFLAPIDRDQEDDGCGDSTNNKSSPLSSEDESDVESLHSFHYSPMAVDMPSAIRLAKRLYTLDGFKKSDISRHLSKNNDFSRAVADEYLKYFDFEKDTLDIALRKFLKQFCLTGETQERERVLVHFSKRYLDCNPGTYNSQDAVHTLTCAIMLLNTDIHGQNVSRKMTCNEFIENLAGLNECENFPRDVLKQLYHAIKNYPLEWTLDEELDEKNNVKTNLRSNESVNLTNCPLLEAPVTAKGVDYKKGYVMRKCCYDTNGKRTPFHKRSWKMFYCTLRDLVLYFHKDENGFKKNQMGDNMHNAIRIQNALATKASDYTKKQYVFRLKTADQAEYLFQTRFSPYVIIKANKDDFQPILKVMHDAFYYDEPTCFTLGLKPNSIMDETVMKNMAEGITLVARCKYDGNIVGAAINESSNPWDPDLKEKLACNIQCPKMRHWLLFQAHIQRFPQLWHRYGVQKVFEISNVFIKKGINPEILSRLINESRNLATDCGYNIVRINATKAQISEICKKLNMKLSAEIPYCSYLGKNLKPIFKPPHPNKVIKIYIDVNPPCLK